MSESSFQKSVKYINFPSCPQKFTNVIEIRQPFITNEYKSRSFAKTFIHKNKKKGSL